MNNNNNGRGGRGAGFSLVEILVTMAILGLLSVLVVNELRAADALERYRPVPLINYAFGTAYQQNGGSNVVVGNGLIVRQGDTNSITATNTQVTYSTSLSTPFSLIDMQNVPVWWQIGGYTMAAGASNMVLGLDLSQDGTYWASNVVQANFVFNGTNNTVTNVAIPFQNGTNFLSGWAWARWSYVGNTALTNVVLFKNQLNVFR